MTTAAAAVSTPSTAAISVRGRFLWTDLMVPDVEAATRFYSGVTGWTLTPWAMGDGVPPYVMWTGAAGPVGGVMPLTADEVAHGARPYWLAHVGTPDLDATYAQALALGAQGVVPPTDIPEVGRFAILADPHGAMFSAYQPANAPAPASAIPGVGEFSWFELATADAPAALAFYTQLFGWERTEAMDMGPAGVYQLFGRDGVTYGAIYPASDPAPPSWLLYVRVADMAHALDAVRGGGGRVLHEPREIPGGDFITKCADPFGVRFAVHASAHAPSAAA